MDRIRASFRRELRRVRESKSSGASGDDVYKPTLWCFDLLLFTADQENPRKSKSNLDEEAEDVDGDSQETRNSAGTPDILSGCFHIFPQALRDKSLNGTSIRSFSFSCNQSSYHPTLCKDAESVVKEPTRKRGNNIFNSITDYCGEAVAQLVETLYYNSEGYTFDSR